MKPVHFTRHARERMAERLAAETEVTDAIREGAWQPVEKGRYRVSKWYPFREYHKGTFYAGKDVEPVFSEEPDVTVYVYLNQREEQ